MNVQPGAGQPVYQGYCPPISTNQFYLHFIRMGPVGGIYKIVTPTGLCLEPESYSTSSGARIVQNPCVESQNQRWVLSSLDGSWYQASNSRSYKCIDVPDAYFGTMVRQSTCDGGHNQQFRVI
jgi:hypothetical protein